MTDKEAALKIMQDSRVTPAERYMAELVYLDILSAPQAEQDRAYTMLWKMLKAQ